VAKTQPTIYRVSRDFVHTQVDNVTRETQVVDLTAGETYQPGEYFSKGEFLPAELIPAFEAEEIIEREV